MKATILKIALLIFVQLISFNALAQTMSGIGIGNSFAKLKELGIEPAAKQIMGPFTLVKYALANGNDLSATYETATGKIVFLETDWNGSQSGSPSDFPSMKYGITTLD